MKINLNKIRGSVLFTTLLTTGIICIYLGGYLSLVRNESQFTARSQTWNSAVPVAEAGVEEAMTQLQANFPNIEPNNGWTWSDKGNYLMKTHWLNDKEYYRVGIFPPPPENKGATPTIVSEGFAQAPLSTDFISRTIRVNTKVGTFLDGLVVVKFISMNGITSADSFNSSTNTLSTDGRYDPAKRNDKVYIATLSGGENLDIVTVYGSIGSGKTDPGKAPSIKGAVGDKDWQKTEKGIQDGHYQSDINTTVEYWKAPFTNGPMPQVTGFGKSASYVLGVPGSTEYRPYAIDNLSGNVTIQGNTQLLVTKTFNVNNLTILPNATLQLYVAAPSVDLSGNNQLNVQGKAANFVYFGLPSNPALGWPGNKTLDAGGNGEFSALIYAPGTDLILHGGGSSTYDFSGAGLINSVTFKGHYAFHYDESAKNALARNYIAVSWDEIRLSWDTILDSGFTASQLY